MFQDQPLHKQTGLRRSSGEHSRVRGYKVKCANINFESEAGIEEMRADKNYGERGQA